MSAFTPNDFTLASVEHIADNFQGKGYNEVNPNFNGPAGLEYANLTVTNNNELVQGMLFTALYGLAAPNTITIQFTAPLYSVSTTTSDYTLSGPGGTPSISSVVWLTGSRSILLNLSGSLSTVNTYTLAIANNKVLSGSQVIKPQYGTFNWPNLVVDVILPAEIDTIGVGIEQDIAFGTPAVDNTGLMTMVGIEQDIGLGTPVITTIVATTGVGIEQDIVLGTPVVGLFDVITGVGFSQPIALGVPVITQQQEPVGVGFVQSIALGTPDSTITPETPAGVGISEIINFGTPVVAGSGSVVGVGIAQSVVLGTPVAHKDNTQDTVGVGIAQVIALGTPAPYQSATLIPTGFDQPIDLGTPLVAEGPPPFRIMVGIEQDILVGLPNATQVGNLLQATNRQAATFTDIDSALQQAYGDGVSGAVNPNLMDPIGPADHYYRDTFTTLQQHQTKTFFEDVAAAAMVILHIPGVQPTVNASDSTSIASTSGTGSTGTLTFVDGRLVTKVDPN